MTTETKNDNNQEPRVFVVRATDDDAVESVLDLLKNAEGVTGEEVTERKTDDAAEIQVTVSNPQKDLNLKPAIGETRKPTRKPLRVTISKEPA